MSLQVGQVLSIQLLATLAGLAGTFEGAPAFAFEPTDVVGTVTVAEDNLSATAVVARDVADAVLTVTVDNVVGSTVGTLTGTAIFTTIPADVISADALEVTVS